MKIGVSSYSFQQLIDSGEETQLSIMKKPPKWASTA